MVKLDHIKHVIELSEGVGGSIEDGNVTISTDGTAISREFLHPRVSVSMNDGNLEVFCDLPRRKEKALAGTWAAHLRNMNKGVSEGFEYRLKAVYSHFPMTRKVGLHYDTQQSLRRARSAKGRVALDACRGHGQGREQDRCRRHRR